MTRRPLVLLGLLAFSYLTDKPEHATWLEPNQRDWLIAKLEGERKRTPRLRHASIWKVLTNKYVLIMELVYAGASGASTSLALWDHRCAGARGRRRTKSASSR